VRPRQQTLGGPCYYFLSDGTLRANPRYSRTPPVVELRAADLPGLGIPRDRPIYRSWLEQPDLYRFMACPESIGDVWTDF
jgi:hypothetical protein